MSHLPSTSSGAGSASASSGMISCSFEGCRKKYKTQKGYDNHLATVHKIKGVSCPRPATADAPPRGLSDLFNDVVVEEVDPQLSPHLNDNSPVASSGVSSQSSAPKNSPFISPLPTTGCTASTSTSASVSTSASNLFYCPYDGCNNFYKFKRSYDTHVFQHQIEEIERRKPDRQIIDDAVNGIVLSILEEIRNEPCSSEMKIAIITNIVHQSSNSPHWLLFVKSLTSPIIEAIIARSKLMPKSQYEDFLSRLNHLMNKQEYFSDLNIKFVALLTDDALNHCVTINMILFRLCFRLGEEIQIFVLKQMSSSTSTEETEDIDDPGSGQLSHEEQRLLTDNISSLIRSYYNKASNMDSEVWRVRCACIRHKFVKSANDSSVSARDIMNKFSWGEGQLTPHEDLLDFCKGVECVIRSKLNQSVKTADNLCPNKISLYLLEEPQCIPTLNKWHSLTIDYLSELDSVFFMRNFVAILIKASLRPEGLLLKCAEEERQRPQQFATRDNLKRN